MSKIIVLDTETTGLSCYEDEILQLAIIDDKGECLFNEFFKPQYAKEWYEASKVNNIYPKHVADKPHINEYLPKIQEIIDQAEIIIAYNAAFDLSFLAQAGIKFHLQNQEIVDVMLEFAPIYGEWSEYFGDYKWQKLTTCTEYFEYIYPPHDALADVRATLFAYKEIKALKEKKKV